MPIDIEAMCVYTALIGDYEDLNEQIHTGGSRIPLICLTDDPSLRSDTWQIRPVRTTFEMDPIRSQRIFKLRPQHYLPEFRFSLYIDNSVLLLDKPENFIEKLPFDSGFCLPSHSHRERVIDEFLEVAKLGWDDQSRIFEQLNHYTFECPEVLQERPYWNGIMLRDHENSVVRSMLDVWLAHVLRYSRRDQLSVNAAFRWAGLVPDVLHVDNFSSWFHNWPLLNRRDRAKGTRQPATSLSPPIARVRALELERDTARAELDKARAELEQQITQAMAEAAFWQSRHDQVVESPFWKVTFPLRRMGQFMPSSWRGLARRALRGPRWK
jgi:hypothetical protein